MPYLFGVIAKKNILKSYDAALDDFSFHSSRPINYVSGSNHVLAASGNTLYTKGNKTVLFAGRLFGQKQIAKKFGLNKFCSAQLILKLYKTKEMSFLSKLNGEFCFAIFDNKTNELILANDYFGIYPMFVYNDEENCIFSTEYEPILKYKKFNMNIEAVAEYFMFGSQLGNKTFFKDLGNLPQGSIMKINGSKHKIQQYADFNIKIKLRDIDYHCKKILEALRDATADRLSEPEQVICNLSGGADTRLLLSLMDKGTRQKVTFRTEYKAPNTARDDRDVMIARKITQDLGLKHIIQKAPKLPSIIKLDSRRRKPHEFVPKTVIGGILGGEFLGESCNNLGVDLRKYSDKEIRKKLDVFNTSFLEKVNPFMNLNAEFKRIPAQNKYLFMRIQLLTRAFFTDNYGGRDGGLMSPWRNPLQVTSIYYDARFLRLLLEIPEEYIKEYKLYNLLYKDYIPELNRFPTNSPIALKTDSCHTYYYGGVERKETKRKYHRNIIRKIIRKKSTWKILDEKKILQEFSKLPHSFWQNARKLFFKDHLGKELKPFFALFKNLIKLLPQKTEQYLQDRIFEKKGDLINRFLHFELFKRMIDQK